MHRSAAAQEEDNVEMDHCLKVWIIALGVAVVADRGLMHLTCCWHVAVFVVLAPLVDGV